MTFTCLVRGYFRHGSESLWESLTCRPRRNRRATRAQTNNRCWGPALSFRTIFATLGGDHESAGLRPTIILRTSRTDSRGRIVFLPVESIVRRAGLTVIFLIYTYVSQSAADPIYMRRDPATRKPRHFVCVCIMSSTCFQNHPTPTAVYPINIRGTLGTILEVRYRICSVHGRVYKIRSLHHVLTCTISARVVICGRPAHITGAASAPRLQRAS
jgi:hypothetical protein